MVDRKNCTHVNETATVLHAEWCVRCSAWQVRRYLATGRSGPREISTFELLEQHVWPAEETTPDEMMHLMFRLLRTVQEAEQDHQEPLLPGMGA